MRTRFDRGAAFHTWLRWHITHSQHDWSVDTAVEWKAKEIAHRCVPVLAAQRIPTALPCARFLLGGWKLGFGNVPQPRPLRMISQGGRPTR